MGTACQTHETPPDVELFDQTLYGVRKDDSVADISETAATTHHVAVIDGKSISYTARAGHLVAADAKSARPAPQGRG